MLGSPYLGKLPYLCELLFSSASLFPKGKIYNQSRAPALWLFRWAGMLNSNDVFRWGGKILEHGIMLSAHDFS